MNGIDERKMRPQKNGLGNRQHCTASRLRSGSQTRLRSAAKRCNHSQISNTKEPDTLTNLFQDLTEKGETTVTPFIIKHLNGNTNRNKVAFVSVWQHPPVKGPPQLFLSTSGEASLQIANPDKAKARKGRHRLIERPPPSPLVKRLQNFSNRFKTPIFCGSVKKTYLTLL